MSTSKAIAEAIAALPRTRIVYGAATGDNTVPVEGDTTAVEMPAIIPVSSGDYCAVAIPASGDRIILGPIDKSTFLPLDGSDAMTGDLDMDGNDLDGVGTITSNGVTSYPGDSERLCVLYSITATLTTTDTNLESSWTADADPESWAVSGGITPTIAGWYRVTGNIYADDSRDGEVLLYVAVDGSATKLVLRDDSTAFRRFGGGVAGMIHLDGTEKLTLAGRHFFSNPANVNCDAMLTAQLVRRDR